MKNNSPSKFFLKNILVIMVFTFMLKAGCSVQQSEDSGEFKAGISVIDITPPIGYPVHGVISEGAYDPVTVKTMVFEQGMESAAIVMVDLFYIELDLSELVRRKASEETGIPFENICVAATHTHTDPSYVQDWEQYLHKMNEELLLAEDKDSYIGQLIKNMVHSVADAKSNLKPVSIKSGSIPTESIVFNRRFLMNDGSVIMNPGFLNPDMVRAVGPVDPDLGIILMNTINNDKPVASFTTFGMQLATIGSSSKFSAGFPYFLERGLQDEFGDNFISVFGEGPCADVNHWDVSKPGPQIGYETATKPTGKALAETFLRNLSNLKYTGENLAVSNRIIQIPLQTYSDMDLEWAKNYKGDPPNPIISLRVSRILDLEKLRTRYGETLPMEVQVFRINSETAIVALPGQIFVELGLALKEASPFANTLIVTLANSHEECIPLRKAYTEGSYEVIYSRVEAGGGELLVETALELLEEVK